jgi:hypothetical protein
MSSKFMASLQLEHVMPLLSSSGSVVKGNEHRGQSPKQMGYAAASLHVIYSVERHHTPGGGCLSGHVMDRALITVRCLGMHPCGRSGIYRRYNASTGPGAVEIQKWW